MKRWWVPWLRKEGPEKTDYWFHAHVSGAIFIAFLMEEWIDDGGARVAQRGFDRGPN